MAFLGLLIFIIIIFIQPQEFIPALRGLPLVDIAMGIVIIGCFLQIFTKKRVNFLNAKQNILMIIFWFVIIISTLRTHWLAYTFNTAFEWAKFVIIYFLLINVINSQKKLEIIVWAIILSMSVTAGMGILQYYGIDYTGVGIGRDGRIRGIGIFDTNQLAYTLTFVIPLVLALFAKKRNFLLRMLFLLVLAEFYYAIYLTESRGGLLCSVIIFALIFIVYARRIFVKLLGVGFAFSLFLFFLKIVPRLHTVSDYKADASAKGRLDVWGEALIVLKSYPLFGVGKNQFNDFFSISPHSSYIQVVAELGLAGLFIWLAIFYNCFKNLIYIDSHVRNSISKGQKIFPKFFQVSLYAYLIGSFFSGNAYYITLYILLALAVALQYLTNSCLFNKQHLFSLKDMRNIGIIEIAIILIIHWLSIG